MSLLDHVRYGNPSGIRLGRRFQDPAWISAGVALVEGMFVAVFFYAGAAIYHFTILGVTMPAGPQDLYLYYCAALGSVYAMFSAAAAARFLRLRTSRFEAVRSSVLGWAIASAAALMVVFVAGRVGELSRVTVLFGFILGLPVVTMLRGLMRERLAQRISDGKLRYQKLALMGHREDVRDFMLNADLERNGREVTDILHIEEALRDGLPATGAIDEFARRAVGNGVKYIVVAGDPVDMDHWAAAIETFRRFALNVVYAPSLNEGAAFRDIVPIGSSMTLGMVGAPMSDGARLAKRCLDIVGAAFGLVVLGPLLLIVAALVRLDSPGPALYRQARRGINGEVFSILKFRTMSVMESGFEMRQAQRNDARFTRIGRFLRATSIDELPQLINVLRGEMSLVGPRPHAVKHDNHLAASIPDYALRQRVRPGITGWAQVNGWRGETTTLDQMEARTAHDLYYIENYSFMLDIRILLLTLFSKKARKAAF